MYWKQIAAFLAVLTAAYGAASRWRALGNPYLRFAVNLPPRAAGMLAYLLPFLEQPRLENLDLNLALGGGLFAAGVVFRLYAVIHLWRINKPFARGRKQVLVDSGPYRLVRHPQLAGSTAMLGGWFLLFGALYSLCLLPLFLLLTALQAGIEERFVLQERFGEEYRAYRRETSAFFPRPSDLRPR